MLSNYGCGVALLAGGADVNAADRDGLTVLHLAVLEARQNPYTALNIVATLLQAGARACVERSDNA